MIKNVPRWFWALALVQWAGYACVWLLLHFPETTPTVSSGWYVEVSAYAQRITRFTWVAWLAERPNLLAWLLLACFGALCLAHGATILLFRRHTVQLDTRLLIWLTAVLSLPLLFLPRLLSSDVFQYAMFGRIAVVYDANPLIDIPAHFPRDPLLPLVAWKTTASVYGPAWIDVSLPLTFLARLLGDTPWAYAFVYKAFALACHLASIAVIVRLLHRVRPATATWGTLLYGWHPLTLIEFAGSGHNDSLMLLLVLLALCYAQRRRRTLALLLLIVAALVKLVAALPLALYALHVISQHGLRKQRWRWLIRQGALASAVVIILYAPWWAGWQTLSILITAPPLTQVTNGPAVWVVDQWQEQACRIAFADQDERTFEPDAPLQKRAQPPGTRFREQITTQVRQGSLGLFAVVCTLLVVWSIRTFGYFVRRAVIVLTLYVLLAAVHFEPWYATWSLALMPFLSRQRAVVWASGATMLLLYALHRSIGPCQHALLGVSDVPYTMLDRLAYWREPLAFAPLIVLILVELWAAVQRPLRSLAIRMQH